MLAADIDIKIVSDALGHRDTRITRDIYQSVRPPAEGRQEGRAIREGDLVPVAVRADRLRK